MKIKNTQTGEVKDFHGITIVFGAGDNPIYKDRSTGRTLDGWVYFDEENTDYTTIRASKSSTDGRGIR